MVAMKRLVTALALGLVALSFRPAPVAALAGTHGPAVSTWDTTASTVVGTFHTLFLPDGLMFIGSYNANFTSTSGNFSAQFGLHYLNYPVDSDTKAHGISGTAVAVWSTPLTGRYDNGLPIAAFGAYIGGAPAALISGTYNYLSIPIVAGIGFPWSPAQVISIIPWVEISGSLNLDTVIKSFNPDPGTANDYMTYDEQGNPVGIDASNVSKIMQDSVEWDINYALRLRGGLTIAFHAGDMVDIQLRGGVAQVGPEFVATPGYFVAAGLAVSWDDIVPAVLPMDKKLNNVDCELIEQRFKRCEAYTRIVDGAAGNKGKAGPGKDLPLPDAGTPAPAPAAAPAPAPEPSTPAPAPAPEDSVPPPAPDTPAPTPAPAT
jgi:hypothetical protein